MTKKLYKFNFTATLLLTSSLLLISCASNKTVQLPQIVKVPVAARCAKPNIPPKPHLAIANLEPNSSPDVVMKAYVSTIEALQGYNAQLLRILKGYDTPKKTVNNK